MRVGGAWPESMEVTMLSDETVVFSGVALASAFSGHTCEVRILRHERHFAIVFLHYSDSELPEALREYEVLYAHRPEEWEKAP
jgi:hypothetical protein